jgi:hypothetical protein
MLGYQLDGTLDISQNDYFNGKNHVLGKTNPEPVNNPFWLAMVKSGRSAYYAADKFDTGLFTWQSR